MLRSTGSTHEAAEIRAYDDAYGNLILQSIEGRDYRFIQHRRAYCSDKEMNITLCLALMGNLNSAASTEAGRCQWEI